MSVQSTTFNPYMNSFNSYATMGDIYGMDDYNYAPLGSPMSIGGGWGGINYQQYYDNMMQMQEFYTDYNIRNAELQRRSDITINNVDAGLKKAFEALQTKIVSSEQEQIIGALENFKNAVRAKYPTANEEQIANYTTMIYSQLSGGTSLVQDIQTHGSGSFMQGFKQSIGFGLFADNKTAEENIAEITGQPESRSSKMSKHAGRTTGGIVAGAVAGFLVTGFNPLGALAGAIIGGVGAFARSKTIG